ncbi:acyl-CoA dehydrogenase family protein [Chloroflexota bacterium]
MIEFSEEHQMWRKTVEDFLENEGGREYVRKCDMERQFPEEFYKKLAEQGWVGINMPEKYGGQGADLTMQCILIEVLARYSYDFANAVAIEGAFTIDNILLHGSEEMKQKYLSAYCKGDIKMSISMTEPEAGSDVASLTCSAVLDGNSITINGTKMFASGAGAKNNVICLAARTDKSVPKHEGISLILVPNDTPGLELNVLMTCVRRASRTYELVFIDCHLPRENLIGEPNKGWEYLMEHLEVERITCSAGYVGNAQQAVTDALNYAKQRVQFGRPIVKFQVLRHMLADRQTEVDAARLLTYRAAAMRQNGIRCMKEAAMAKLFASETFYRATTAAMQIYGGYAQLPESDVERYWRESKQAMIGGGSSQIQRTIIAREMER